MYMRFDEVKAVFPGAVTMEAYAEQAKGHDATVIVRDYDEPTAPPCMQTGVELFDFEKNQRPQSDLRTAYGTRPNIPGVNVVNGIKAALGTTGYSLHISDGSYTGYSIWELQEFLRNFDSTNLKVWIAETFDCDDFAQVVQGHVNKFFHGIAFGTIWYGPRQPPNWGHAVNLFFSHTDNQVYLVEPQNDTFYKFDIKNWAPWMVII